MEKNSNPGKTYLLDCRVQNNNVNHQYVIHLLDNLLRDFQIERQDFCLLLSDATKYSVFHNYPYSTKCLD